MLNEPNPFQATPETSLGERKRSQPSLVEAKTLEVEAKLDQLFATIDPTVTFKFNEVAELLESQRAPVVHALEELDMLPETDRVVEWTSTKIQNSSKVFTQEDVLLINKNEKVRTLTTGQVKEVLGLKSQKEVAKLAKNAGIKPIKPVKDKPDYGTFNLDQVEELREALGLPAPDVSLEETARVLVATSTRNRPDEKKHVRIYKATKDQIAASALLRKLGITNEQLGPILETNNIEPVIIHPEGVEEGEPHLTNEDASLVILHFMKNNARKKAKKPKLA